MPPIPREDRHRLWAAILCGLALGAWCGPRAGTAQTAAGAGVIQDVQFTDYGALSANTELLRRMLSPLANRLAQDTLAASGKSLVEQSIDLSKERFAVYTPAHRPPRGYGLLVFVPPWAEAKVPPGWVPVLETNGVIYVSAARSGNDQNVLTRRAPLALLGLDNIRRRYAIDPDRIYIGGFSGGSRVALRLALAYPDVFRGVFLNAGADPIGAPPDQLPAKDLLWRFQEATRIAYVTGERDINSLSADAGSERSMRRACVFGVDARTTPSVSHEVADPAGLSWALRSLAAPTNPDPAKVAACRTGLEGEVAGQVAHAEALIAKGDHSAARDAILKIDATFGALAAPMTVDLAEKCGCKILPSR